MSKIQRRQPKKDQSKEEESLQGPAMNLAIINGVMFVITVLIGGGFFTTGDLAIILFGFSTETFLRGFIWTPLTAIFAHGGIVHLAGNMIYLFIYGFRLEEIGITDMGIYYAYLITGILSTILAGFIVALLGATIFSVGASGSIFGLLGLYAGIQKRRNNPELKSVLIAAGILFLFSFGPRTNILAHLFGLVIGYILGLSTYFEQFEEN